MHQFSSVQSLSRVRLFATPWTAAHQASLSITNSRSSPRLRSIESVMPSSHLILCRPFLLLPPIPPSIRVLSSESTLRMRWPKYKGVSALASFLPKKSQGWSPSEWTGWISLQSAQLASHSSWFHISRLKRAPGDSPSLPRNIPHSDTPHYTTTVLWPTRLRLDRIPKETE